MPPLKFKKLDTNHSKSFHRRRLSNKLDQLLAEYKQSK